MNVRSFFGSAPALADADGGDAGAAAAATWQLDPLDCTPATDESAAMMAAYKAACAAGKKDEATRLALQLLAKDPTCFGKK